MFFSLGGEDWGLCLPTASANGVEEGRTGTISRMLGFDNIDSVRAKRLLTFKIPFYLSKKLKAARVLSGA